MPLQVTNGVLLGNIMSKDGLAVDPKKVEAIRKLRTPTNIKKLNRFLRQIKWHTRFMRYLSHIAYPLYALTKKEVVLYRWSDQCAKAFQALKLILSVAPVLQGPDWEKEFHVFVWTHPIWPSEVL